MFRTIISYIYFGIYIIVSLPGLLYLKILKSLDQTKKFDAFTYRIARHWARSMVWLAGGRIKVVGAENIPEGPVLFVGNHQGYFDIPVYLGFIDKPKGFVAKIEMLKLPIFRTWMRNLKCVFMDRNDIRQSVQVINEASELLRVGYSITIFPEGTRSKGDNLGEFKAGSIKAAIKAGVPIVPVAIDGSYKLLEQHKHLHPAIIGLHICPPILTTALTKEELRALPERIHGIINEILKKSKD